MNIIPNNCKLVNIVWIERGIILSLISYIIDNYIKLLEKTIIIDNKNYRHFLSIIFNRLKFKEFTKHKSHYFYFNVRKIIKDQDIIIDYLNNNEFVYADKINLVPWYDMNDPLIIYERKDDKLSLTKYKIFIKNFSTCRRGNYYNSMWDLLIEKNTFLKYHKFNHKMNIQYLFNLLNKILLSTYTNTVTTKIVYQPIEYPEIQYVESTKSTNTDINTHDDSKLKELEATYKKLIADKDSATSDIIKMLTENINNIIKIII